MRLFYKYTYIIIRRVVIILTRVLHFITFQKHHLETAITIGDSVLSILHPLLSWTYRYPVYEKNSVKLFNLQFSSPLTFSSFKYHESTISFWLDLGLGGGCLKTILGEKRIGNKKPRIQELSKGLINAMGLPGPGIKQFCKDVPKWSIWKKGTPIGISIGGNCVEEYVNNIAFCEETFKPLNYEQYYFELNISCPNTKEGQRITENPELLDELLEKIRHISDVVCCIKVSPDQSNDALVQIAKICKKYDKMVLNCGNTQFRTCQSINLANDSISIGGGGLSGPELFNRTCEMISLLRPYNIPIIATGGVSSEKDVKVLLDLGATLIGLATHLVKDPFSIPKWNQAISDHYGH